jgi:hypothetical protein
MAVKKQPDPDTGEISEEGNDWVRQFLKHLELHLMETGRRLSSDTSPSDYHLAAMQAVRLTLLDSGMTDGGFRELLEELAMANQQRIAITDKDAKGYPVGYFEATEGSFANEPLECPPDLPLEERESW